MDKAMATTSATASSALSSTFQSQYEELLDAYYAVAARVGDDAGASTVGRGQRMLELQSLMAQLSSRHGDLRGALGHYDKILSWIDHHVSEESSLKSETVVGPVIAELGELPLGLRAVLPELRVATLATVSAIYHRLGSAKDAMARLLSAKKAHRELASESESESSSKSLELALAANYAALLHAQGSLEECRVAAEMAMDLSGPQPNVESKNKTTKKNSREEDPLVQAARLIAVEVLASCCRAKEDAPKARELSALSAQCLETIQDADPALVARSHNNVGLNRVENSDFETALRHFLTAYRVNLASDTPSASLQATLAYQIAQTLAESGTTAAVPGDTEADKLGAKQWLTRAVEALSSSNRAQDQLLAVAAQRSLGELALYAGHAESAESDFSIALTMAKKMADSGLRTRKATSISKQELVQLQGSIESLLGSALFVQGKFEAAEEAHQRDLETALESEDIHAQLRALRNLAVLYDATRRYDESITLWRESIEIAAVLSNQRDLLVGYSGLGQALQRLSVLDFTRGAYREMLAQRENQPRTVFAKQRALAAELGDLEIHIHAQQAIVGTYEWQPRADELERRLEECDALVRLCDQQDSWVYKTSAYRSLACAITAQIKKLAERGQRFTEAIRVLTVKRSALLQKLREAASKLPVAVADNDRPLVRQPWDRIHVLRH